MNNQNQLSGLDPKLQETFHRVMNTPTQPVRQTPSVNSVGTSPLGGASQNSTVIPAAPNTLGTVQVPPSAPLPPLAPLGTNPPPIIAPPTVIVPPQPMIMNQTPAQPSFQPSVPSTPFVPPVAVATPPKDEVIVISSEQPKQQVNTANSQVFTSKKKATRVSPVIIILGAAVFFVAYTLIWIRVFNSQIPFLQ